MSYQHKRHEEIVSRLRAKSHLEPFYGGIHDIPRRLEEYDPKMFIVRNHIAKTFEVHSLGNRGGTLGFTVPFDELDGRTLEKAYMTDYHKRGRVIFDEIDACNEAVKRENKRLRRDEIGDVAERIQKPLREVAYS